MRESRWRKIRLKSAGNLLKAKKKGMSIAKADTEALLEFNKIKEIWKELALTEWARKQIDEAGPLMEETKVRARLRETTEAKKMMEAYGQPPLVSLEGVKEWMKTAEIGGLSDARAAGGRGTGAGGRVQNEAVFKQGKGRRHFHGLVRGKSGQLRGIENVYPRTDPKRPGG